ncbi:MAG: DUF3667 domain-containing protein [Pseudomonadota bacterium]
MSTEFETAAIASIGGLASRQSADLSGQACRNCGTHVTGRYCENCGQLAASFHRPILGLMSETLADTFSLDGRLSRTLPILLFRPGRLTRNYTRGLRARYVPPFRLFLLASLLFYLVLFAIAPPARYINIDDATRAEVERSLSDAQASEIVDQVETQTRESLARADIQVGSSDALHSGVENRIRAILNNQDLFAAQIETWLPRLGILLVPMTIIALALLHAWRRSLYVYDHAIHALHLHTWVYLTGTVMLLLAPILPGFVPWLYALSFLIFVWRSLMVAGDSGRIMSAIRLFLLLLIWNVGIVAIVVATIIISGLSVSSN